MKSPSLQLDEVFSFLLLAIPLFHLSRKKKTGLRTVPNMASSLNSNYVQSGFKCFWRIENFELCKPSANLILISQRFKVNMLQNSEWHMQIQGKSPNEVGIFLFKDEKGDTRNINIHFSISILTRSGWLVLFDKAFCTFEASGVGYGFPDLFDWDKTLIRQKHISLPTESLTVCLHMFNASTSTMSAQCLMRSRMVNEKYSVHLKLKKFSTLKESDFVNLALNVPQPGDPHSSTKDNVKTQSTQTDIIEGSNLFDGLEDLLRLFKETKFHYVTLRTANKEFAAHKALLCAKSPVFNAMFEMNMKEKDNSIVDIDDVDSDTLSLMLQFLHLEPLEDLKWERAAKLYYAADKYQIEQLKSKCLSLLKKELCEENVCQAFVLADMHQDVDLKGSALEFFCKNSKIILPSLKWKDLMREKTDLASDILSELAERM